MSAVLSVARPPQSSAATGVSWVRAALDAALDLPVRGVPRDVWSCRGLSEVALGCLIHGGRRDALGLFAILDDAVRDAAIGPSGTAAVRLGRVRALAGPVPPGYPSAGTPAAHSVPEDAATCAAARALLRLCAALGPLDGCGRRLPDPPETSSAQLRWGAALRPTPASQPYQCAIRPFEPGVVWRTWMVLPASAGHVVALVERPPLADVMTRAVWRGVHDGAHLDHLAYVPPPGPAMPSPVEYGCGLLTTEAYAVAVEVVAAVETVEAGRPDISAVLSDGLRERITRLTAPAESGHVRAIAEAQVRDSLRLLAGADLGLPTALRRDLLVRWARACERHPAAAALDREAGHLV